MLRRIIGASLQARFLVIAAALALSVSGAMRLRNVPVDVLPESAPPSVEIQTEALGLSAEEVEQLITVPMEHDLLSGVPWLQSMRSKSLPGLSSIELIFERNADLMRARQMVSERMSQAFALPHVSKPPTMLQPQSIASRVMVIGLSSQTLTPIQMSVLAKWTISPRLLGVPGVSQVAIWGQRDRQLQVQVQPEKLREHNVSLLRVLESTGNALWVSSLSFVEASTPGTGGFIETANQRLGIRHVLPIVSAAGLAQVPIEDAGVTLGDVAQVVEDHQPLIGDAIIGDRSNVALVVEKMPGFGLREVTQGIEDALAELRPGLAGLEMDTTLFRPASYIDAALRNLATALLIGLLAMVIVQLCAFRNWRVIAVSFMALTVTSLLAGLTIAAFGETFNLAVLAGYLIALVVVIDEAVVEAERVVTGRFYSSGTNHATEGGAIVNLCLETRGAQIGSTLILLLAVLPLYFLQGEMGALVRPFALAFGVTIVTSMLVATLVTPVVSFLISPKGVNAGRTVDASTSNPLTPGSTVRYNNVGRCVIALFAIGALAALPFLRSSLLPRFVERELQLRVAAIPGISQGEMSRVTSRLCNEIRTVDGVRSVGAQVGRAIFGDEPVNVNSASLWISLATSSDTTRAAAAIEQIASGYPGLRCHLESNLGGIVKARLGARKDPLAVRVYGDLDNDLLKGCEAVKKALLGVPGILDAKVQWPEKQPVLEVEVNLASAQRYGLKPGDVRRAAATMFGGIQVGNLFEEQKIFDVVVWSAAESRMSIASIRDLLIDAPNHTRVRLGDVAEVRIAPSRSIIEHEGAKRYLDLVIQTKDEANAAVASGVRDRLRALELPLECHAEILDASGGADFVGSNWVMLLAAMTGGVLLLLQAVTRSWSQSIATILAVILTISGGILAVFLTGRLFSIGSLAGALAAAAWMLRQSIVLSEKTRLYGEFPGNVMRPVLASALSVSAVFLPALLMGNRPGLELLRPMSVSLIGSLVTATLMAIFLIPAVFYRYRSTQQDDVDYGLVPETT